MYLQLEMLLTAGKLNFLFAVFLCVGSVQYLLIFGIVCVSCRFVVYGDDVFLDIFPLRILKTILEFVCLGKTLMEVTVLETLCLYFWLDSECKHFEREANARTIIHATGITRESLEIVHWLEYMKDNLIPDTQLSLFPNRIFNVLQDILSVNLNFLF